MSKVVEACSGRARSVHSVINRHNWQHYEIAWQSAIAERTTEPRASGPARDALTRASLARAVRAWKLGRFESQIVPVEGHLGLDECATAHVGYEPHLRRAAPGEGVDACTCRADVADGASAVMMMRRGAAEHVGAIPMVTVVDSVGMMPNLKRPDGSVLSVTT